MISVEMVLDRKNTSVRNGSRWQRFPRRPAPFIGLRVAVARVTNFERLSSLAAFAGRLPRYQNLSAS